MFVNLKFWLVILTSLFQNQAKEIASKQPSTLLISENIFFKKRKFLLSNQNQIIPLKKTQTYTHGILTSLKNPRVVAWD